MVITSLTQLVNLLTHEIGRVSTRCRTIPIAQVTGEKVNPKTCGDNRPCYQKDAEKFP